MATHYVSDYEEVTGKTPGDESSAPETSPEPAPEAPAAVETKVVTEGQPEQQAQVITSDVAQTA